MLGLLLTAQTWICWEREKRQKGMENVCFGKERNLRGFKAVDTKDAEKAAEMVTGRPVVLETLAKVPRGQDLTH